jgi:hypothetical protein
VALVAPNAPVSWSRGSHTLEALEPAPGAPQLLAVEFAGDGSYRIEDVPAGRYRLKLRLPGFPGNLYVQEVSIPPVEGSASAGPLNLGTLTLR